MARHTIPAFFSALFLTLVLLQPFAGTARAAGADARPQAVYSGNPKSMKYHNAKCRHFNCKACTVRFSSPEEARAKGYVACKVCKG